MKRAPWKRGFDQQGVVIRAQPQGGVGANDQLVASGPIRIRHGDVQGGAVAGRRGHWHGCGQVIVGPAAFALGRIGYEIDLKQKGLAARTLQVWHRRLTGSELALTHRPWSRQEDGLVDEQPIVATELLGEKPRRH